MNVIPPINKMLWIGKNNQLWKQILHMIILLSLDIWTMDNIVYLHYIVIETEVKFQSINFYFWLIKILMNSTFIFRFTWEWLDILCHVTLHFYAIQIERAHKFYARCNDPKINCFMLNISHRYSIQINHTNIPLMK
jgi:hypothetical protein